MPRLLVVAVLVVSLLLPSVRAQADGDGVAPVRWDPPQGRPLVRYERPVAGEVIREFDGPAGRFDAGHRGVDLSLQVGAPVRAAGGGRVLHAGPVAGTNWITLLHDDGVHTTYGPIAAPSVEPGHRVARGDRIGVLDRGGHGDDRGAGLHWGARRDGIYVDPMTLLDRGVPRPSLIGGGGWEGTAHVVTPYEPWSGQQEGWGIPSSPVAERVGFAVPPTPNHLVLVAGFATSSETLPLDPAHLGYDDRSVTRFSYAGRSGAAGRSDDPHRDQLPYEPRDTWAGVDRAARRLADQLRAQAAREPGRAVDLVGHSMGGLVLLRYLTAYHDPYDRSLPPVANLVTVASPLAGTDLAELGTGLLQNDLANVLLEGGRGLLAAIVGGPAGSVSLDAPAVDQMRPTSGETRALAAAWEHALHDGTGGALATGTRVLTIGGSRDLVVGPHRTALPRDEVVAFERLRGDGSATDGAPDPSGRPLAPRLPSSEDLPDLEHRILPGGHHDVLRTEAVREVAWRFLAGQEVVESPGLEVMQLSEDLGTAMSVTGLWVRLKELLWEPIRARLPKPTVPSS